MDAGMMDGGSMKAGAVGAIEGVRNPIVVARKVMESPPALIVADYARRFAGEQGIPLVPPESLISEEARKEFAAQQKKPDKNTIGCVALDGDGSLACGVSTGGTSANPPGRMGRLLGAVALSVLQIAALFGSDDWNLMS